MQKNVFFSAIIRGIIIGISALLVLVTGFSALRVLASQSECAFCEVLNKILFSGDWKKPGDGTVHNAKQLGGIDASKFIQVKEGTSLTCGENQCVAGITPEGTLLCR